MSNEDLAKELDDKKAQIEILESDILRLDKSLQKQRDVNNQLRRVNRNIEREINQIDSLVNTMLEQLPKVKFVNASKTQKPENKITKKWGIIQLSDIHANTKVSPEEANGNEYNFEVLSKRLKLYINKTINIFKSSKITNVYVVLSGDLVSSTRRDDEKLAQITSLVNASYLLTDMLKQAINLLVKSGFNVTVTGIVGNESRLNQDNFTAGKISSSENFDWVILQMLNAIYSDVDYKKVNIIMPKNPAMTIINIPTEKGFTLLVNHGYGLKANEYGAEDVLRSVNNIVDKIDLAIFGHLHHVAIFDKCCWCGSMIGNNTYSTSKGYSSYASQNIYIIEDDNSYVSMPIQLQNGWQNIDGFTYDKVIAEEAYLKKEVGYGNKGPVIVLR